MHFEATHMDRKQWHRSDQGIRRFRIGGGYWLKRDFMRLLPLVCMLC